MQDIFFLKKNSPQNKNFIQLKKKMMLQNQLNPFSEVPLDAKNHSYKSEYNKLYVKEKYIMVAVLLVLLLLLMFAILGILHMQSSEATVDCNTLVSYRNILYQSIDMNGKPVNVTGYLYFLDQDSLGTKRKGVVWNHGKWNATASQPILCEIARLGYVVFASNFQGHGMGVPDYMGTQIEDSRRAFEYLKKYPQTEGQTIYMGGDGMSNDLFFFAAIIYYFSNFVFPKNFVSQTIEKVDYIHTFYILL